MIFARTDIRLPVGIVLGEGPQIPFQPREGELYIVLMVFELADGFWLLALSVMVLDLCLG